MKVYDKGAFTLVKPGEKYTLRIDEAEWGQSRNNTDVMKVTFVICGGEFDGIVIRKSLPQWILCKLASALGIEKQEDGDGKKFYDVDGVDLRGKYVETVITHREHANKKYNEIGTDFELADGLDDVPF